MNAGEQRHVRRGLEILLDAAVLMMVRDDFDAEDRPDVREALCRGAEALAVEAYQDLRELLPEDQRPPGLR